MAILCCDGSGKCSRTTIEINKKITKMKSCFICIDGVSGWGINYSGGFFVWCAIYCQNVKESYAFLLPSHQVESFKKILIPWHISSQIHYVAKKCNKKDCFFAQAFLHSPAKKCMESKIYFNHWFWVIDRKIEWNQIQNQVVLIYYAFIYS